MFNLIEIHRLFVSIRAAVDTRNEASIINAAEDIAAFIGYRKEFSEVVAVRERIKAGDIEGALVHLATLCTMLAPIFSSGGINLMSASNASDELDTILAMLGNGGVAGGVAAEPATVGLSPMAILLLIRGAFALADYIRSR